MSGPILGDLSKIGDQGVLLAKKYKKNHGIRACKKSARMNQLKEKFAQNRILRRLITPG
jgi:hypothetical protein